MCCSRSQRSLRDGLRPVASPPQLDFCTGSRIQAKNRLGAVLSEADPPLAGGRRRPLLRLAHGGAGQDRRPSGLRRGGPRRFKAGAKHAGAASRTASSRLWGALAASTSAGRPSAPAAGTLARTLVRDILALDGEGGRAGGLAAAELESDEAYRRPLTVPGIDPKAAVALVAGIDASLLPGHNRLAS